MLEGLGASPGLCRTITASSPRGLLCFRWASGKVPGMVGNSSWIRLREGETREKSVLVIFYKIKGRRERGR